MIALQRRKNVEKSMKIVMKRALRNDLDVEMLKKYDFIDKFNASQYSQIVKAFLIKVLIYCFLSSAVVAYTICYVYPITHTDWIKDFVNARCLLPNNYIFWEAVRPIADCNYCINKTKPKILRNASQKSFMKYAYQPGPTVVKNSIKNWRAMNEFNFNLFKHVYEVTKDDYINDDECLFLNFGTDIYSIEEMFNMSRSRARNEPEEKPWYIGWGVCNPKMLTYLRQYYSVPEFLPADAEYSLNENIFIGYEKGAVTHLDYIPRFMWQGQVKATKKWVVSPVFECQNVCNYITFLVEPGDILLLDTRIWFHATFIQNGELSITVQSEYG